MALIWCLMCIYVYNGGADVSPGVQVQQSHIAAIVSRFNIFCLQQISVTIVRRKSRLSFIECAHSSVMQKMELVADPSECIHNVMVHCSRWRLNAMIA